MTANLFRKILLTASMLVLLAVAVVAYGRQQGAVKEKEDCCVSIKSNHNTEMPWESLARQLMGAVML